MSDIGGGGSLGSFGFRITGDASSARNAASQANASLATLEKAVAQNWWGIRNLGYAFSALPAAVVGGVTETVRMASQIQDAMVGVARTTGLTGDSLDSLQQQLFAFAQTRATPTIEILGVAEMAGSLGIAQDDLVSFTQNVVDFSSVTNVSTQAAATGLARLAGMTGITAGGMDNLASSITRTGQSTTTSEADILQLAQRLTGIGAVAHLSAAEIVGWSGAMLAAGARSNESSTAFQRLVSNISDSVGQNGAKLQSWAQLIGTSGDQFRAAWGQDSSAVILQVVEALGQVINTGGDVIGVLGSLGISDQRQIRTLLLLAQAQGQSNNEAIKASTILATAGDAYQNTERYQSAVEQRNKTFSASLQELENTLQQTGAAIGNVFIGPLQSVISIVQQLALGVNLIPGPIKAVGAAIILFTTAISAIGAIVVIFGARIIQIVAAFQKMQGALPGVAAGTNELAGAQANAAGQAELFNAKLAATNARLIESQQRTQGAAEAIAFMAGEAGNGAGLIEEYNAAVAQGSAESSTFGSWLGRVGNAAMITGAIMVGLTAYTLALGRAQQRVEEQQQNAQKANEDLTAAMRRTGSAVNETTQGVLSSLPAYQSVIASAHQLGISEDSVKNIISGSAGGAEWQAMLDQIDSGQNKGSDSANAFVRNVYNLRQSFKNSAGDAGVAANAVQAQADATGNLGDEAAKTAEELNKFRDQEIAIAQATVDFIDASLAARSAQLDFADAYAKLQEAQYKAAHQADAEREAQLKLSDAYYSLNQANEAVTTAEENLAHAREDAAAAVAEAMSKVAGDRDAYLNDLDKIKDQEKALYDLQNNGVETTNKITDATNKLNDARLRLWQATLNVSDLEQNLAYLQQQGAGSRDIEQAQLALAQAQQEVSDSTGAIADAQQALNDLTDPVKRAEAIDKAERDLAQTRRDAQTQLRSITTDERALSDARDAQARDTKYIDAQKALVDAQLGQVDAINKVHDAQKELDDIRGGSLIRDVQRDEIAYEQAMYRVAAANVEVDKQTALMNGDTWDAGKAAHDLADRLGEVVTQTDAATESRKNWIAELEKAPNIPPKAESGSPGDISGVDPTTGLPNGGDGVGLPPDAVPKAKATFMDALAGIVSGGGAFILAQLGVSLGKALYGRWFPSDVAKTAGTQVGDDVAAGVTGGLETEVAAGLPGAVEGGVTEGALAVGPEIAGGAGASALGVLAGILAAVLVDVFIIGFVVKFKDWFAEHWWTLLMLVVINPVAGIPAILIAYGWQWAEGLYHGLQKGFDKIWGFLEGLPDQILGFLEDLPGRIGDLFGTFKDQVLPKLQELGETILGFFLGLPSKIAYILGYVLGIIIRFLFVEPIKAAINFGPGVLEAILGFFLQLPGMIWGALQAIPGIVGTIFSMVWNVASTIVIAIIGGVVGFFMRAPGMIWNVISNLPNVIGGVFSTMGSTILSVVGNALGNVLGFFAKLPGMIWNFVQGLPSWAWNFFSTMGENIWNGFLNFAGSLLDWFWDLPGKIWDAIKNLASDVFGWFGDIGSSIWDGFHDAIFGSPKTKIEYTLDDVNAAMVDTVANVRFHLLALNGLNVDPFAGLAASIQKSSSAIGDAIQGAGFNADPTAGIGTSPGVVSQGSMVTNNYYDTLNQDVKTDADPDEIVNEWVWAKRLRSRS